MEQNDLCNCGRTGTHCRRCGARSIYAKKFRSMEFSAACGKQVTVYGCRVCGQESNITEPCDASPRGGAETDFTLPKKPQNPLTPGTAEHFEALTQEATKYAEKKRVSLSQGYVEMIKKGWDVSKYELDDEVKRLLECPAEGNAQDQSEVGHGGDLGAKEASLDFQEPVSLDDIIKGMQEEQK